MLPVGRKESLLNMAFSLPHLPFKGCSSVLTKYNHFRVDVKGILWLTSLRTPQGYRLSQERTKNILFSEPVAESLNFFLTVSFYIAIL